MPSFFKHKSKGGPQAPPKSSSGLPKSGSHFWRTKSTPDLQAESANASWASNESNPPPLPTDGPFTPAKSRPSATHSATLPTEPGSWNGPEYISGNGFPQEPQSAQAGGSFTVLASPPHSRQPSVSGQQIYSIPPGAQPSRNPSISGQAFSSILPGATSSFISGTANDHNPPLMSDSPTPPNLPFTPSLPKSGPESSSATDQTSNGLDSSQKGYQNRSLTSTQYSVPNGAPYQIGAPSQNGTPYQNGASNQNGTPEGSQKPASMMPDSETVAVAAAVGAAGLAVNNKAVGGNTPGGAIKNTAQAAIANGSQIEKGLDWIDDNIISQGQDKIALIQSMEAPAESTVKAIGSVLGDDQNMKAIADTVDTWIERSDVLLKALDAVATVHPIIGVAVLVLKTAVKLELNRRDNDRKIGALRIQRVEMMQVLLDLKGVKDREAVAADTRLNDLLKKTADDIKDCAHACDQYLQKKLVVKVLKSSIWSARLVEFSTRFQSRKSDFQFALAVHTSQGVDAANATLATVKTTVDSTQESVNMLLLFKMLESPKEREMMKVINAKGGPGKVMADEKLLRELAATREDAAYGQKGNQKEQKDSKGADADFTALRKELNSDVDAALQRERTLFDRKFDAQTKQLSELKEQVTRESDRVISTLLAGPGDRIKDKTIHEMWKDMGWKSSVKSSRFVLTLRDYYIEKYSDETKESEKEDKDFVELIAAPFSQDDQWALTYISFLRLQPINEAFDDDASGFVSVKEVNAFTSSRPADWSLPHWVAYWAAGWHLSLLGYVQKISHNVIPHILFAAKNVLPGNRASVDRYIGSQFFRQLDLVVVSLNNSRDNEHLLEKFQSYVDAEEKRLESNLQSVGYDIDAANTLALVTGTGRLERYLLPLLYLIYIHHFKLITLCGKTIVDDQELYRAAETLASICDAIGERLQTLAAVFNQQHVDAEGQFKHVAHGMFEYNYSPANYDEIEKVLEWSEPDPSFPPTTDVLEEKDLKYIPSPDTIDRETYDSHQEPASVPDDVKEMIGLWDGFFCYDDDFTDGRMSCHIHVDINHILRGSGSDLWGAFSVAGTATPNGESGNKLDVNFRLEYTDDVAWEYHGSIDAGSETMKGEWGSVSKDDVPFDAKGKFIWEKRTALSSLRSRPSRKAFEENRGKALWFVARSAIRQYLWTWSFFKERRDNRLRFIELYSRHIIAARWTVHTYYEDNDEDSQEELQELERTLGALDTRFYVSLARSQARRQVIHYDIICDVCRKTLVKTRHLCLECSGATLASSVDLCDEHVDSPYKREADKITHNSSHKLYKTRRYRHYREKVRLMNHARDAFERADELLTAVEAESFVSLPPVDVDDASDVEADETIADQLAEDITVVGSGPEQAPQSRDIGEAPPAETAIIVNGVESTTEQSEAAVTDLVQADHAAEPSAVDAAVAAQVSEAKTDQPAVDGAKSSSDATQAVDNINDGEEASTHSATACSCCGVEVSRPCWFCTVCEDDVFICPACDSAEKPSSNPNHDISHGLVRCPAPLKETQDEAPVNPIELRLTNLEERYAEHTAAIDRRLDALESNLDTRLVSLEQLLGQLISKLSPSQ